jgi:hypothetical protein
MENIILKNMKIMENMSNTLEEIKNYVNEIMEELIVLKLLRQLRGGVNQFLLCLNNFKSIKPILIFHQVTINIIHHMNNINNEHQSYIRYTQRHIFTRKPIKGENLFFFEMIGSLLSSVHHLCLSTNSK